MAKRSFKGFVEQELGKFPHFLIYAVLEWLLIFVLFIDGFLAFFANEFAKFFELKIPCLLCTRIDHVLFHRDADFYYNDSICESHKKDVSGLAYCHTHKKLSDIKKLCEACLLSFATEKESDCDTYKSLIGILHKDIEMFVDEDQEVHWTLPTGSKNDTVQVEKRSLHRCSCCGAPLKKKSRQRGKKAGFLSQAPAPSPRAPFVTLRNEEIRNAELSRIGYTELKFSGNEPEPHRDDDGSNPSLLAQRLREDVKDAAVPLLTETEDINEERMPTFIRGNKLLGIPLTDSANASPRWAPRLTRKSPVEKTEFASESTEGNMPNEADGDSILTHLKRQVRLDRKSLMALCMELDEERSASAVAANEAMAMISRLQTEKAAVQMEALQYQRMMEEQAEYDQEAFQATKDLLSNREEEIKALEDELEAYRIKYGDLSEDENYQELKSHSYSSCTEGSGRVSPTFSSVEGQNNGERVPNDDQSSTLQDGHGGGTFKYQRSSQRDRSHNLGRLKNLDKKTDILLNEGPPSPQSSYNNANNMEEETGNMHKSIHNANKIRTSSIAIPNSRHKFPSFSTTTEQESKANLAGDLSHLHEPVKALEADNGFSEHAIFALQNIQKLGHFITDAI